MHVDYDGERLTLRFNYSATLVEQVKTIPDRKWDPDRRVWTIPIEFLKLVRDNFSGAMISPRAQGAYQKLAQDYEASRAEENGAINPQLPGGFMLPYQQAGVAFVEGKKGYALIGDDMGLGKSCQALAYLHRHPDLRPVVIVCPASVKIHWYREIQKWLKAADSDITMLGGRQTTLEDMVRAQAFTWVIINWDILADWRDVLSSAQPKAVVFDEIHYAKDLKSKRAQTAKTLAFLPSVQARIGLSGTPVINQPQEVWSEAQLINPKVFPSWWSFGKRYLDMKQGRYGMETGAPNHLVELEARLRANLMIRREKKDVLPELPDLRRVLLPFACDLSSYQKVEAHFKEKLLSWRKHERRFQARLAQMSPGERRAAVAQRAQELPPKLHVRAADIEPMRQEAFIAKSKAVWDWINDFLATTSPLVLFAHHRTTIDYLEGLRFNGAYRLDVLDGAQSQQNRQRAIDNFQAGKLDVLVCGLRIGQGFELSRGSHCAFVEFDWTSAIHDQCEGRLHRMGQKNAVTSYYLMAAGTIDEAMVRLIENKRKIVAGAIGDDLDYGLVATLADELLGPNTAEA